MPLSAALVRSPSQPSARPESRSPVTLRTIGACRVLRGGHVARVDPSIPIVLDVFCDDAQAAWFMVPLLSRPCTIFSLSCSRVASPCRLPMGTLLSLCEPFEANRSHKIGTSQPDPSPWLVAGSILSGLLLKGFGALPHLHCSSSSACFGLNSSNSSKRTSSTRDLRSKMM